MSDCSHGEYLQGCCVKCGDHYTDIIEQLKAERDGTKEALLFYMRESEAIAKNFDLNDTAVLASITVLKLDAGNRANKVLSALPEGEK